MENDLLKDTISKYRDDADLQNLIDWVQADWASIYHVYDVSRSRGSIGLLLRQGVYNSWKYWKSR